MVPGRYPNPDATSTSTSRPVASRGSAPLTGHLPLTLADYTSAVSTTFSTPVSPGDRVTVPWEMDERPGVVRSVDQQLVRAWVEIEIDGRPESFSFPLDALTRLEASGEGHPSDQDDLELDSHHVLKPLLDALGPDRPVSVGLLLTRDDDANLLLQVDVTLLAETDQSLPADQLIDLHDRIRSAVYQATDYQFAVVVRVGWREERFA